MVGSYAETATSQTHSIGRQRRRKKPFLTPISAFLCPTPILVVRNLAFLVAGALRIPSAIFGILASPRVEHHAAIDVLRGILFPASFGFILLEPRIDGAGQDAAFVIESIRKLLVLDGFRIDGRAIVQLLEAVVEVAMHLLAGIEPIGTLGRDAFDLSGGFERKNRDVGVQIQFALTLFLNLPLFRSPSSLTARFISSISIESAFSRYQDE